MCEILEGRRKIVFSYEMSSQGHADKSAVLFIMVPWSP